MALLSRLAWFVLFIRTRGPGTRAKEMREMVMGKKGIGEEGFTLVEIAITLAIAGIVAMIAIPSFIGIMPRLRLSNDMATLTNEIALARARAISKNDEFRIIFSTAGDSYTLRNESDGISFATNTLSGDIDLYQVSDLGAAATLAMRGVGSIGWVNAGAYQDLGLGVVPAIALKTSDDAYRKRVRIENTGRVYVERWNGTVWAEE